ncbi:MAG: hypothetical protein KAT69_02195 [Candidatus Aminicenantes bacterium]|nr:hypothetical protein [Candidatus Aminicenantes bacterium]
MKKTLICLFSLFFLYSIGLYSTQDQEDLNEYDGKFWTDMPEIVKVYFLDGFLHGIKTVYYKTKEWKEVYSDPEIADAEDKKKVEGIDFVVEEIKYYFNVFGLSLGKLESGLDTAYKEEENRVIPIHRIIIPIAENLKGEISDDLLQDYLADLRDIYTK